MDKKVILVTGAAGFIGYSLIKELFKVYGDSTIVGVDNLSACRYRLDDLTSPNFIFVKQDISDKEGITKVFEQYRPSIVVNLAAKAGVRKSITDPDDYITTNIVGFYNILECCRHYEVEHLIYASSSSVYGDNSKVPYSTEDKTDSPLSLYAASKKCDEILSYSYSKLYNIKCTGLRFFTVYGPYGRPDMFYYKFVDKMVHGEKVEIYNYGECLRDFTYIDDIVRGIVCVIGKDDGKMCSVYNIGCGKPQNMKDVIRVLEREMVVNGLVPAGFDFEGYKEYVPMADGDMEVTYADTSEFNEIFRFQPSVNIEDGIKYFISWYSTQMVSD